MDAMEEQAMDMPWNQADSMEQHADSTGHKSKKDKSHKEEKHKKEGEQTQEGEAGDRGFGNVARCTLKRSKHSA